MENREYIVTAFTENQVGVLNRITAIYLRRKINIESLRVVASSTKGISMFVITAITSEQQIAKVVQHISKIVEVVDSKFYTAEEVITLEVALYKASKSILENASTSEIITRRNGSRIIEFGADYIVVTLTGSKEEIDKFKQELTEHKALLQFTRSGSVIMHREQIDIKY